MEYSPIYETLRDFFSTYGMWLLLAIGGVKVLLGIIVAVKKEEFKWFYIGNFYKNDGLKFVICILLMYAIDVDLIAGLLGAILTLDYTAGIIKNIAHLSPPFADGLKTTFREPAKLRLGNPKNLPS